MQISFVSFVVGLLLAASRRRPRQASLATLALAGQCGATVLAVAGHYLCCLAAIVPAALKALDGSTARKLAVLAVFAALAEAVLGGGASVWVALFFAAKLPWFAGSFRSHRPSLAPPAAPAAPPFDEAAFVSGLKPLPDADLRRMADGIARTLQGPVSAQDRQDLAQQRRLLYRTLDERRAGRRAKGSAPARKGP